MKDMDISALLEQWAVCIGQRQGDLQAYTNMQSQSGALEMETQRFTAKTATVKKGQLKKRQPKKRQRKIGLPQNWATVKFGNEK